MHEDSDVKGVIFVLYGPTVPGEGLMWVGGERDPHKLELWH